MIKDAGRSTDTALRDLLRRLDRQINASHPVRPSATSETTTLSTFTTDTALDGTTVTVGDWVLSQDAETGDLVATDSTTGAATVVARKGEP